MDGKLIDKRQCDQQYPIGLLKAKNDSLPAITIHFMHYGSFEEARLKWYERAKRVNWDNIFVVNTCAYDNEINQVNDKIIRDFNLIKYKKVILTRYRIGFNDEYVIEPPNGEYHHAYLLDKQKYNCYKRVYNIFDFRFFLKINK